MDIALFQAGFTALKIICVLPVHLGAPSATIDLFTVSIVFSFSEGHIVGIIQYVDISDWPLPLSNMQFRNLCVFS